MPRLRNKVPSYRLHKATDQAVVTLNDRYFFNGLPRDCAIRHWGNHILGCKRQRTGPLTHADSAANSSGRSRPSLLR